METELNVVQQVDDVDAKAFSKIVTPTLPFTAMGVTPVQAYVSLNEFARQAGMPNVDRDFDLENS